MDVRVSLREPVATLNESSLKVVFHWIKNSNIRQKLSNHCFSQCASNQGRSGSMSHFDIVGEETPQRDVSFVTVSFDIATASKVTEAISLDTPVTGRVNLFTG